MTPDQIWLRLTNIFKSEKADIETDFREPTDLIWRSKNLSFNYFHRQNGNLTLAIQANKSVWEAYMRFHESFFYGEARLNSWDEEEDSDGNYVGGPEIFNIDREMNFVDLPHAEYYIKETKFLIDISKGLSMEKYLVMQ
jgi:hypothetical protein